MICTNLEGTAKEIVKKQISPTIIKNGGYVKSLQLDPVSYVILILSIEYGHTDNSYCQLMCRAELTELYSFDSQEG